MEVYYEKRTFGFNKTPDSHIKIILVPNKPVTEWLRNFLDHTGIVHVPGGAVMSFSAQTHGNLKRIGNKRLFEILNNEILLVKVYKDFSGSEPGLNKMSRINESQLKLALMNSKYRGKTYEREEETKRKYQNMIEYFFKNGESEIP